MAVTSTAHFPLEQSLLRHWINQARTGDQASFERILAAHERMVLRTAQRLLMNREDARDAAQEVFLRLHRNLGRFQEAAEIVPWLYRVTVNICFDWKRRSKSSISLARAPEAADRALNPEQASRAAEERELVLDALRRLPERERLAIVLRDIEGRSTAEVAEILGSAEGTIRSQISIGRSKIRKFVLERTGATR